MYKYCNTAKGTAIINSNLMDGEGISISLDAKTGGGLIVDTEFDSSYVCNFMNVHINLRPQACRLGLMSGPVVT